MRIRSSKSLFLMLLILAWIANDALVARPQATGAATSPSLAAGDKTSLQTPKTAKNPGAKTPASEAPPAPSATQNQPTLPANGGIGSSQAPDASGSTTPAADASGAKTGDTPQILRIVPAAPLIAPNQPLTLTGSGFKKDVKVTFTDPQGNPYPATVIQTSAQGDQLVVLETLGIAGTWKVSAANPDGKPSNSLELPVANSPALGFLSPSFIAFLICALVASFLLGALIRFVIVTVNKAQSAGWSLGDALSEESTYQPKEITGKSSVITFASTSRLIAFIGLMGILGIVVGIGYAIIWNLTIYGTVPDLSQVRSFLYGAACLFAPYVANQVSSAFTPAAKTQAPSAAPAGAAITGRAPSPLIANAAAQPLHLTGSGFQDGLSLTLIDPLGASQSIAAAGITGTAPTLVSANAVLNTPGSWKASVVNPGAAPSGPFTFTVLGAPKIEGVQPAAPTNNAAAQLIVFAGSGFMSGLKVELTPQDRPPCEIVNPDPNVKQVAVNAVLDTPGKWEALITNPGGYASNLFPFTVQ